MAIDDLDLMRDVRNILLSFPFIGVILNGFLIEV